MKIFRNMNWNAYVEERLAEPSLPQPSLPPRQLPSAVADDFLVPKFAATDSDAGVSIDLPGSTFAVLVKKKNGKNAEGAVLDLFELSPSVGADPQPWRCYLPVRLASVKGQVGAMCLGGRVRRGVCVRRTHHAVDGDHVCGGRGGRITHWTGIMRK